MFVMTGAFYVLKIRSLYFRLIFGPIHKAANALWILIFPWITHYVPNYVYLLGTIQNNIYAKSLLLILTKPLRTENRFPRKGHSVPVCTVESRRSQRLGVFICTTDITV